MNEGKMEVHFFDQPSTVSGGDFYRNASGIPRRYNQVQYAKRLREMHSRGLQSSSRTDGGGGNLIVGM